MMANWLVQTAKFKSVIRRYETERRIGLHPWEKHPERPTRLIVTVELYSSIVHSKVLEEINETIDYDHIKNELDTWPERHHTDFLEDLIEELKPLCFKNKHVSHAFISILKPDIFNKAEAAGVEVLLSRDD